MYLQKLAIYNYKSCRSVAIDFYDTQPNTFIGKTDVGKSTILQSIGLLLNEKDIIAPSVDIQDPSDISTTALDQNELEKSFNDLKLPLPPEKDDKAIYLIGFFKIEEEDLKGDFESKASPLLQWTIDSHSSDQIILLKQYNKNYPEGRYLICTKDGNADIKELWGEGKTVLDKLRKEKAIPEVDISNENGKGRFKNIEVMKAIYSKIETTVAWRDYPDFKKDKFFFPVYRYLSWKEMTCKDVEGLAKDTMASFIEKYKEQLYPNIRQIEENASKEINSELQGTIAQITSGLPNIKAIKVKVNLDIGENITDIMIEKENCDGPIKLESQGEGVKKQIGYSFLKWKALSGDKSVGGKKFIWAFDEPEVHLYPTDQRDFFESIKELCKKPFQIFISTHSTIFVDKSQLSTIKQVSLRDKYTQVSSCESVGDVYSALEAKNSDFLFFDFFIAGEGDTEKVLIPYFYKLFFGKNLEENSINFINLGGCKNWKNNRDLFEQTLKNFKDPDDCVYYLLDKDEVGSTRSNVYPVGTYTIEDSIENKYWITLVKRECNIDLTDSELNEIRANLGPSDPNKKFHGLLKSLIFGKSEGIRLPEKKECAVILKDIIVDVSGIPADVKKLFEDIKSLRK